MSCENWLPLIEEYLDGELDRKKSSELQAHFASCKACADEYELLKREMEIYSGYDRGLEPSPNMWLAVQTRIREEEATRRGSFLSRLREIAFGPAGGWHLNPALAAMLVVAAIAVTVVIMRSVERRQSPQIARVETPAASPSSAEPKSTATPREIQPIPGEPVEKKSSPENEVARANLHNVRRDEVKPKQQTPQQVVNSAVEQNLLAIKVLTKEISKRRSDLDPMEVARFESALRSVDRTIAETREAVRQHPNDPVAAKYMLDAYAQKVEIMTDMAGARPMSSDEVAHPDR